MRRFGITLTALTLACTTACGSLPDDEGEKAPLVTLHGSVQSQSGSLSGSVHVALVWGSGNAHALAVETPVQPEFPAGFSLPVKSAPPAGFITPVDDLGGIEAAFGVIVAYRDDNGNGKLDLLDESSEEAIDHVVGTDKSHFLVFLKTAPALDNQELMDENGAMPVAGFNILAQTSDGKSFTWAPLSTDLMLTEDDSPDAQSLMCERGTFATGGGGSPVAAPPGTIGPDGAYPSPDDPDLICYPQAPDQYGYAVTQALVDRPCYQQFETVTTLYSKEPGTSPAGWPCSN